ncbi:tat pathway signal sequence [Microdochium trichocladiopsis]|uniref:Tat pathway signal sequence n=1 Tax=Microdochium trichocladiopsis TaxID=1682393 RepID=A0A9P8Y1E3_9PEZI|nr:tat pathway signal sequence [Microdochium trichocladiopsis]KAH7028123.1 tat pathway signal sequence [Microdochium trichocladiopsis]
MLLNAQLRQTSTYSPIHDIFDLGMQAKKINGTLFPSKESPSIARHSPSAELDDIWNEWELTRVYPVTAAQIRSMGKDPSTAAKLEDDVWGLGDDAYAAIFDVYHQLHCLNFLRKLIYPSYYNTSNWHHADVEGFFEIHMNHCVDIVMQAIQCSGNVNLITLHWVETQPYPFPDMSVNRQCVNFEGLTQWRLDNTIDMDKYGLVMQKPKGVKQQPAPEGYYEMFGNKTDSDHTHEGHSSHEMAVGRERHGPY